MNSVTYMSYECRKEHCTCDVSHVVTQYLWGSVVELRKLPVNPNINIAAILHSNAHTLSHSQYQNIVLKSSTVYLIYML